jgi:ubiquinone biosynthesis protein
MTSPTIAIERLEKQAVRVAEIIGVLAEFELSGWVGSLPIPRIHELLDRHRGHSATTNSREENIRLACTMLGTTFIKVGQMLSTRADLIGPDLAKELSKLQSNTPPDAPDVVRATVESELGKPPEEIFAAFEPEAFASASVAQVHRAWLPTGEAVVVKVQKAGIQAKIEADLAILASIAELLDRHSVEMKSYEPVRLVAEFKRSILAELDFTREQRNLEVFGRNFAEDDTVRFPRAWGEYSSKRVLTMDYLEGVLGSQTKLLEESGEDLSEFARRGATIFLDMIFRDSFYHADPHPGNLMLLPGDIVGIIDCGMVGRLDDGLHDDFESLMIAVSKGDSEILTDTLWNMSMSKPTQGRDLLLSELSEFLAESTQASLEKIDFSETLTRLTEIIRKYKIKLRPGLTTLMKTLVLLEGTSQLLNPKFSLAEVMEPYQEKILLDRFSPQKWGRRLQRNYREWDRLIQTLPRDISQTVQQFQAGQIQVRVEHRRLDTVVNRLVMGIIVAALLLGSSLCWGMKAPPLVNDISIIGMTGYAFAISVGWVLFRSISKTDRDYPED